jgi:serine/threonine protein kinase
MPLELNTILHDRYLVLSEIGSGGMSTVYLGRDESLGVEVVIKENMFASLETARQFRREANLLASLRHPNLPRVTDTFSIPGMGQYLIMDYVRGEDARHYLERTQEPIPENKALKWMRQIFDALIYLHAKSDPIIHRDIKPANIIISSKDKVMLVDFGLAKEYDPMKSTTAGAKALTPGFAPPEQYGQGRTDVRTDIYSLGATIYNLITALVPADGLLRAIEQERLTPVREVNPNISHHVAEAIQRAMSIKPEDRFGTVEEFATALFPESVSGDDITAKARVVERAHTTLPGSVPTELAQPVRQRNYLRIFLMLIVGIVIISIGIWALPTVSGMINRAEPSITPALSATKEQGVVVSTTQVTDAEVPTPAPSYTPLPEYSPTPEISPSPQVTSIGSGPGQIAFVSERLGLPQIFIINIDGSELSQLSNIADGACQPTWSPDGQHLLFTSPCQKKAKQYPNAGIFIMNADGTDVRPFITLVGGVFDAEWSGAGVAFTYFENNRPGIWIAGEDGSEVQRISRANSIDSQPNWSPEGDKLVFVNTSALGSPTIFWMFSDGSFPGNNPEYVTRNQIVSSPDWSPTGKYVAYTADNVHIFLIEWDAKGYNEIQLTIKGPNADPAWSPDGQWLAFESWRETANHDIYVMMINGSQVIRLTTDEAWDYQPAWRP